MSNIVGKIEGDKLVLVIDVSAKALEAAQPSGSGKTLVVATTSGFAGFGGPVKVSLNATIANPHYVAPAK